MKVVFSDGPFELYSYGFGADDPFQRKKTGIVLSDLVEKVSDPLVIALDGDWGSGKTWFLKRWVGAHTLENHGTAVTIYFDAFANDYLEDPLVALTALLEQRVQPRPEGRINALKQAAYRLARPTLRIGLSLASAGITEVASAIVDSGVEAAKQEIQDSADEFWKAQKERMVSMEAFRDCLLKITSGERTGQEIKIVIVIDELDRCRPDYALLILETIKHFFSVENVHFVLGTNLRALENSVKARYGSEIDAHRYLKRFVFLTLNLQDSMENDPDRPAVSAFTGKMCEKAGLGEKTRQEVSRQIELATKANKISFRDCEALVARLVLLPRSKELDSLNSGYRLVLISLVLIRIISPELYWRLYRFEAPLKEIQTFYGIKDSAIDESKPTYDHSAFIMNALWMYIIDRDSMDPEIKRRIAGFFGGFGVDNPERFIRKLDKDYISVLQPT